MARLPSLEAMRRILNVSTNTIHRPRDERGSEAAACGSLVHVPERRTRVVPAEEVESDETVSRCGGCFDDAGGY